MPARPRVRDGVRFRLPRARGLLVPDRRVVSLGRPLAPRVVRRRGRGDGVGVCCPRRCPRARGHVERRAGRAEARDVTFRGPRLVRRRTRDGRGHGDRRPRQRDAVVSVGDVRGSAPVRGAARVEE